jgi:hypothetical protein
VPGGYTREKGKKRGKREREGDETTSLRRFKSIKFAPIRKERVIDEDAET